MKSVPLTLVVREMLTKYDKLNNWFKTGVYAIWPSAHARNSYSNLVLSYMSIGIGALRNFGRTAKLFSEAAADEAVEVGSFRGTNGQLRQRTGLPRGVPSLHRQSVELWAEKRRAEAERKSKRQPRRPLSAPPTTDATG